MDPTQPITPTTTTPVPNTPAPITKSGKSKHLILILLIVFPPLAWYYMWKEDRYHNWFASVLIVDGLIFLATAILLLGALYPPLTQIFTSLKIEQPATAKIMPYLFIATGILEILYGAYLRLKTHHMPSLPKSLLIPVIILLSIHFIGLPLGQAASYLDLITKLYTSQLNYYNTLPQQKQQITPQPTSYPISEWMTYDKLKKYITFKYPSSWFIQENLKDGERLGYLSTAFYTKPVDQCMTVPTTCKSFSLTIFTQQKKDHLSYASEKHMKINETITSDTSDGSIKLKVTRRPDLIVKDTTALYTTTELTRIIDGKNITEYLYEVSVKRDNIFYFMKSQDEKLLDILLSSVKFTKTNDLTTPSPSVSIPEDQFACTMDAKICPDGSSVGRTGPNCEFSACPN